MKFDPWLLFVDLAIIAVLLLIGQFLRAKVKLFQRAVLPAALLAGIIGLIFGPNCLKILPLSNNLSTYSSILVVFVFAALPLGKAKKKFKQTGQSVFNMYVYSELALLGQHAISMLFALLVLAPVFHVPQAFGYLIPASWAGGPATVIAAGTVFKEAGWADGLPVGLLSYTLGMFFGIVGGVAIINYAARKGYTAFVSSFANMPKEYLTGLIPKENQKSLGKETIANNVIDSLMFHLGLALLVAVAAYYFAAWIVTVWPGFHLPAFAAAALIGTIFQGVLRKFGVDCYIDESTMKHLSSTATDILVTAAIASVKIASIISYAVPLILTTIIAGIGYCLLIVFFLGPRVLTSNWFEKSIFTYGWLTGVVSTSMILLRMIDPQNKSGTLEDFSLAYIPMSIVDMFIVTLVPMALVANLGCQWTAIVCLACLLLLFIVWKMGWWKKGSCCP